jgi:predicted Rossmann fold nucleotide-binding protein DprA/Smf involved in DNA uptake
MDPADPLLARVILSELPQVGEQGVRRVLAFAQEQHLELADVLRSPPSLLADGCRLPKAAVTRLTADGEHHTRYCQALLARARDMGIDLRTLDDISYPQPWRRWATPPPPLVYLFGADTALTGPAITVLNSRNITARSVSATVQLVERATVEGFSLITGGM